MANNYGSTFENALHRPWPSIKLSIEPDYENDVLDDSPHNVALTERYM